jgi:TonB-dependent receptor
MEDFLIRFGAAKMMARSSIGFLTPGAAVSVSGNNRTVNAGNPEVDPFRANSYDLSFEWYFAEHSLFSVAFFHKDVDSFVQTVRETRPFTGNPLGLPDSVATAACPGGVDTPACNPSVDWQFNIPLNTPGGPVKGYEIGLQLPFTSLPGFWSHFGFLGNYTHVESEIDYVDASGAVVATDNLTGLSEQSYNLTFYYEDDHFSGRVSGAYRSDYLTQIPGRNLNASESTAETFNVDTSLSWAFNEHLRVTFEGLNLTDEVNDQFLSPDDRESFYHHFGRQYFLGVRYNY